MLLGLTGRLTFSSRMMSSSSSCSTGPAVRPQGSGPCGVTTPAFARWHGRAGEMMLAGPWRARREARDARRSPSIDGELERAVAELSEGEAVRSALADICEAQRRAIKFANFCGHTYAGFAVLLER